MCCGVAACKTTTESIAGVASWQLSFSPGEIVMGVESDPGSGAGAGLGEREIIGESSTVDTRPPPPPAWGKGRFAKVCVFVHARRMLVYATHG